MWGATVPLCRPVRGERPWHVVGREWHRAQCIRLPLISSLFLSPGRGCHGYCHLFFIFSFLSSLFSINSLQLLCLLLLFSILLPLLGSLSTQSSHHILGLPRLPFPLHYLLSANVSSPILPTWPTQFSPLLTSVFLKLSFTPTSTPSSSILHSHDSSYPVVFANLLLFSVSAIVSKPYMYAGVTHKGSTFPFKAIWSVCGFLFLLQSHVNQYKL